MKTENEKGGSTATSVAKRELSWIKVMGLGIASAVSGNFSGWNLGLGVGGWGGMAVAALVMAIFYILLARCVAELAAAFPQASGMDSYAGYGLGRHGGFIAGISVALALSLAVGLGINFISAYCESVLGLSGWAVKAPLLLLLIGVQLRGAREAVGFTMVVGFLSVFIVILFCASAAPHIHLANLSTIHGGTTSLIPTGLQGIIGCVPFALFLFLGVEQAANAAGDMGEGRRNLPKALFVATGIILCIGFGSLLFATGLMGVERLAAAGDPLFAAITSQGAYASDSLVARLIGGGAILSLIGTVFSFAYGASRQFQSLATEGHLPSPIGRCNQRGAPHWALILVGVIAALASLPDPNVILVVLVFSLSICTQLVLVSFVRLRVLRPALERPYRASAGVASACASMGLSLLVMWACSALQREALVYVAGVYALLAIYTAMLPRKNSPVSPVKLDSGPNC